MQKEKATTSVALVHRILFSACLRYQNEGQADTKIFDVLDHFLEKFL